MTFKTCPNCYDDFEQIAPWQKICKRCYAKTKTKQKDHFHTPIQCQSGGVFISTELLKKLRMLAHPDRHNGSKLATSATAELNKICQ